MPAAAGDARPASVLIVRPANSPPVMVETLVRLKGELTSAGFDTEIVFPSLDRKGQPLSNNAMLVLLGRMGYRASTTVHGFRSTFRDWAAHCTNFPRELAEKALAHTIGDETARSYQCGDLLNKRRKLMEAWAGYCTRSAVTSEGCQCEMEANR